MGVLLRDLKLHVGLDRYRISPVQKNPLLTPLSISELKGFNNLCLGSLIFRRKKCSAIYRTEYLKSKMTKIFFFFSNYIHWKILIFSLFLDIFIYIIFPPKR